MGAARGMVFAGVSFLPSILVGVIIFLLLGGADQEWSNWMWGPCYVVPFCLVGFAGWRGWTNDPDQE